MTNGLTKTALLGSLLGIIGVPGTALGTQLPGGADSVKVRALATPANPQAGDQVSVAVALEHAAGFHSWPHEPVVPPELRGVMPIATTIEVLSLPEGAVVEEIQWPAPVPVIVRYTRGPVLLLAYTDTAVAQLRLRLESDQPAEGTSVALRVRYQACDERVCYPPKTVGLVVPLWHGPARDDSRS
jgi:DsbC/DsbD-like thiol-disulfide interchange protein